MNYNEILKYIPTPILNEILCYINKETFALEEIRIRVAKPVILKFTNKNIILKYQATSEDILQILQYICENSIYSYQKQICEGFITIKGGHRIGISGSAVMENGKLINIKYISNINIRIARQIIGCSDEIIKDIINFEEDSIYNTLIISPPGVGKTTLLKDIIRNISNGMKSINFNGKTIGVVDERGEIAAMYKGVPQNDLGIRTDVIDNIEKYLGMTMLIRSMSPEIIVADEIGSKKDSEAINYAVLCGVKGVFTAHGNSLEDVKRNPVLHELIEKGIFDRVLLLDKFNKGKIKEIYKLDKKQNISYNT